MAEISIIQPGQKDRILRLGSDPVTVGRSNDCEVPSSDVKLSRKHMVIGKTQKGWYVEDLKSRNGVKVNGNPVSRLLLKDGDRIEAGSLVIVFQDQVQKAPPRKDAAPAAREPAPPPKAPPIQEFVLLMKGGAEHGKTFPLAGPATIGRGRKNTIALDYDEVSGTHLRLDWDDDAYTLVDEDSTNGTLVNGMWVKTARLKHGDEIEVGPIGMLFLEKAKGREELEKRFLSRKHTREAGFSLVDAGNLSSRHPVSSLPFEIGSSGSNHLVATDDTVSTSHARLVRDQKTLYVEDLGSTNGTYLNGHLVKRARIGHGDELSFGNAVFFLKNDEFPLPEEEETPAGARQKRIVLYGGVLAVAAVLLVALFLVLDMMERKPGVAETDGNLLSENPGFEAAIAGDKLPGWDLEKTAGHEFLLDYKAGLDGSAAVRISAAEGSPPSASAWCRGREKVKAKEGEALEFSCGARSSSLTGAAGIRIRWLSDRGAQVDEEYSDLLTGTNGWVHIRTCLKVPQGAAAAAMDLFVLGRSGTVWFDNARVARAEQGRKGREKTVLADKRLSASFTGRGIWSLAAEGETKISGGRFLVASSSGACAGSQETCLPARGYPKAGRGFVLRAEIVALPGGFPVPFEESAEVRDEGLSLSYRFDPGLGLRRGDAAAVAFSLPPSFAKWGVTAVTDSGETALPFKGFAPLKDVKGLIFRDSKDVLRLRLGAPASVRGFERAGMLNLVLGFRLGSRDEGRLGEILLEWSLPPGRVEARGLELLEAAHSRLSSGELGLALAAFEKVRDEFAELKHLADPAVQNIARLTEAATGRKLEIEAAVESLAAGADKKALEDLLFKARDFGRKFAGSRFAADAEALETRAADAYAASSGSEPFRRHLKLYRDARAAFDSEDWTEAVRLLNEICDSLEDTPMVPVSQEFLDSIEKRRGNAAEAEEWAHQKFNASQELEAAGDLARAAEVLRGILRRYPKSDWAKKASEEISRLERK